MTTKKRFTKKQILERLAYWKHALKRIDETRSPILNALEKDFGDSIYSNEIFVPTNALMNKVFVILNKALFSNQLPLIEVQCLTTKQIQTIFDDNNHKRDAEELYAVYFPLVDFKLINFQKKNQWPSHHYLMINISKDRSNFSFVINSLCHEMIHYLDTIKGDLLFQWKLAYDHGKLDSFDEHKTEMFMRKQQQFNKDGLTIIPDDGGFSQADLNAFSQSRMQRLREMEESIFNKSKSHMVVSGYDNEISAISF